MKFPRAILLLAMTALATPLFGDVAVILGPNGTPRPILSGIIDDPDPVGTWTRTFTSPYAIHLNPDTTDNGRPTLHFDPVSGTTVVAYAHHNGTDYDVVVSVFAGTAWSAPVTVAGGSGDQLDPEVARDDAGNYHVVFWENTPGERVLHAVSDTTGLNWAPASVVSQPGDVAVRPAIAFHQGQRHIAYESHNFGIEGLPKQIVLATFDGNAYGYEVIDSTQRAGSNRIQLHSAYDRLWIDWIDDAQSMAWQRRSGDGDWTATRFEPFGGNADLEYDVRKRIQFEALEN